MADDGFRDKLTRQGEETLGRLAQELLENPLVSNALTKAFGAREAAVQAQEVAMGALNLPSAADIERLTRRIRSISQRLEGIEDALDRLDQRLGTLGKGDKGEAEDRTAALESQLATVLSEVRALASALDAGPGPVPREQERLDVEKPGPAKSARTTSARKPAARKPAAKKS